MPSHTADGIWCSKPSKFVLPEFATLGKWDRKVDRQQTIVSLKWNWQRSRSRSSPRITLCSWESSGLQIHGAKQLREKSVTWEKCRKLPLEVTGFRGNNMQSSAWSKRNYTCSGKLRGFFFFCICLVRPTVVSLQHTEEWRHAEILIHHI